MSVGHRKSSYCVDREWMGRADCTHCAIRSMMLFSRLPTESFDQLLQPIDNERHYSGSLLYNEGNPGKEMFSIRRGLVKLTRLGSDGSERIVRLLGKGAVVGLELLDRGTTYKHTAVTVQDVDLCRIPLVTLLDLERHHPELCASIRQQLQYHVDRADHWIKHLNTGKARSRIAELLLLLADIGADQNGDIELLSRDDMASIAGITKETASRIIAEFKRHRLIYKVAANNTHRIESGKLRELIALESGTD
ncbi:MAG: Crp/Fnr family transcriptional regulator [Alcanivoracaceae bacterium]|jgi:CRP-like cAMP-binding protein|nr:Crp/Fnr family transcriptional regulator [Alcanivoracaceae bacterium]